MTALPALPKTEPAAKSRFTKTPHANLVRDRISGVYFCRAKVAGELLRKSLKTRSLAVALKLRDDFDCLGAGIQARKEGFSRR